MFSRIYQSARSLVYNPQTKSKKFSPSPKRIMVTAKAKHAPLDEEEGLNDENTINVYVPTPSSKRRKRVEAEISDSEASKVVTPSPKKRKVLPVRTKGEEELLSNSRPVVELPSKQMAPEAEIPNAKAQPSAKKVHRRFDSEDQIEDFFSTAREQAVAVEDEEESDEEEDEDSDDDAPEAVGMQEAAQTVKSREQDAAKAVKEQKEASRRKRKERDEALKKQSEVAKKRKPRANAEKVITKTESDEEEEEEDVGESEEDEAPSKALTNSRGLPDLLPLEFLEDDGESNEVILAQEATKRKSTKVKFRDLSEKAPKDKRIGATTYRVTKIQNTSMAPKVSKNARSVKDAWIAGRAGTSKDRTAVRKPVSKGFFKK